MTLKEEICKYAGIITENVTPEQLGDKLSQLLDKGTSLPELVKVINTLCRKDWVHVTPFNNEKMVKLSLTPMNWNSGNGNIADLVVGKNSEKSAQIRNAIQTWIKQIYAEIQKQYPGFKIVINNKKD